MPAIDSPQDGLSESEPHRESRSALTMGFAPLPQLIVYEPSATARADGRGRGSKALESAAKSA